METKFVFALLASLFLLLGCATAPESQPPAQPSGQQEVSGQAQQPELEDPGVEMVPEIDNVTVDDGDP